jgi:predicted permease
MNWAIDYIVGPEYLQAMGIPLQRGRFFSVRDNEKSPLVVVVDDVFAQKYFPHQDPIGKRIQINRFTQLAEIVGVVGHVRQWGLDADDRQTLRSELYIPCMQMPDAFVAMAPSGSTVVVRSDRTSTQLVDAVRHVSAEMSSQQVVFGVQTLDALVAQSLAARRFSMILLTVFASLALLLASIGIYGVISYVVAQRAPEIGLRMALGAQRFDVLRLVVGAGGKLAATGVVVGVAAAWGLTRLMTSLLYGVRAVDPVTFSGVALLLLFAALAACYIPARRAAKVDPMVALRCE